MGPGFRPLLSSCSRFAGLLYFLFFIQLKLTSLSNVNFAICIVINEHLKENTHCYQERSPS